jgi:CheY-like chemotaxis protein
MSSTAASPKLRHTDVPLPEPGQRVPDGKSDPTGPVKEPLDVTRGSSARRARSMLVLLVDNSREFLKAAARFLSADRELEIAHAFSGSEALEQVTRLHPDLVMMDLAMPEIDGLSATRAIKKLPDAPQVVIVTVHDNQEYRAQAKAAGADGFISKSEFVLQAPPLISALRLDQGLARDH